MALDGYATLTLEIHIVKHLSLKILTLNGVGVFKQSVGQSTLAVVNMGYYAEVADILHYIRDFRHKVTKKPLHRQKPPRHALHCSIHLLHILMCFAKTNWIAVAVRILFHQQGWIYLEKD